MDDAIQNSSGDYPHEKVGIAPDDLRYFHNVHPVGGSSLVPAIITAEELPTYTGAPHAMGRGNRMGISCAPISKMVRVRNAIEYHRFSNDVPVNERVIMEARSVEFSNDCMDVAPSSLCRMSDRGWPGYKPQGIIY